MNNFGAMMDILSESVCIRYASPYLQPLKDEILEKERNESKRSKLGVSQKLLFPFDKPSSLYSKKGFSKRELSLEIKFLKKFLYNTPRSVPLRIGVLVVLSLLFVKKDLLGIQDILCSLRRASISDGGYGHLFLMGGQFLPYLTVKNLTIKKL